jgi:hypothetical protein
MTWKEVHLAAVAAGRDRYIDPASGYVVFTELFHLRRNKCCGSGCRHCPFSHADVPEHRRLGLPPPWVATE